MTRCPDCDAPDAVAAARVDPAVIANDLLRAYADAQSQLEEVAAERDGLRERRDALLALVASISQSTPLASELEGWEGQRAALVAEVGTLRARVVELEAAQAEYRESTLADLEAVHEAEMQTVLAGIQAIERDRALGAGAERIAALLSEVADLSAKRRGWTHLASQQRAASHTVAARAVVLADRLEVYIETGDVRDQVVRDVADSLRTLVSDAAHDWPATLGRNLAMGGALHMARYGGIKLADGYWDWQPGRGKPHPHINDEEG